MDFEITRVRLRPMTAADIPQVLEIERDSFPSGWPPVAYAREIENHLARYLVAVDVRPGPTASPPATRQRWWQRLLRRRSTAAAAAPPTVECVVGFLGLWLMVDEAHIVIVAVRPELRRRGIGELLVAEALAQARERGAKVVTLEVRVSNTGAQALYEKYGFRRVGIRKHYYTDNGEDAVIMTTPPLDDAAYQARLEALRRADSARHTGIPQ